MDNIVSNILLGANHFFMLAALFTIPFLLTQAVKRKLNFVRLGMNYAFLFYIICVIALVFFPIPTLAEQGSLTGHHFQAIPFHFFADIIRETPFVWNQPHTYLAALLDKTVLQVVFNIFMTIPFGMYLRYNFHFSGKKVMLSSFLLSSFIEIGQLTGLFFLFSGSYRLCDADDFILNTLGGVIGYAVVIVAEKYIPTIEHFDIVINRVNYSHSTIAS